MTALLLAVLMSVAWTVAGSRSVHSVEHVMWQVLRQATRCPEGPTDREVDTPVAAFSPARYIQLVALVRNQSAENFCGERNRMPFNLDRPNTWSFCAMGVCTIDDTCSCFRHFTGAQCAQYEGDCWLLYCRLVGCGRDVSSLLCSCDPEQDGSPVITGLHFYDEGLRHAFIPPPRGLEPTEYLESHLVQRTGPYSYEIIQNDYYADRASRRRKANSDGGISDTFYSRPDPEDRVSRGFYSPRARDGRRGSSYFVYKPYWRKSRKYSAKDRRHSLRHPEDSSHADNRKFRRNQDRDREFRSRSKHFFDYEQETTSLSDEKIIEPYEDRLRRDELSDEDDGEDSVDNYAVSLRSGQTRWSKFPLTPVSTTLTLLVLCYFL